MGYLLARGPLCPDDGCLARVPILTTPRTGPHRIVALLRKTALFVGSDEGGELAMLLIDDGDLPSAWGGPGAVAGRRADCRRASPVSPLKTCCLGTGGRDGGSTPGRSTTPRSAGGTETRAAARGKRGQGERLRGSCRLAMASRSTLFRVARICTRARVQAGVGGAAGLQSPCPPLPHRRVQSPHHGNPKHRPAGPRGRRGAAAGHGGLWQQPGLRLCQDDRLLVEGSRLLPEVGTLKQALLRDLFWLAEGKARVSPYWRPLVSASYYLDHAVGANPGPFTCTTCCWCSYPGRRWPGATGRAAPWRRALSCFTRWRWRPSPT